MTTNLARYVKTADGEVRLTSAAEFYTNEKGQQLYYETGRVGEKKVLPSDGGDRDLPAYAIDYIELDLSDGVAKKDSRYEIHARDYANPNGYVNAVDDTEFYVVKTGGSGKITYFVGYDNVPEIKAEDIIAAYAVARNTESDSNKKDYWVADVIVIEVKNYDKAYESISLGYYNPYQTSGRVQAISSLNSETEKAAVDMIPTDNSWGSQWKDEGFYEVADSKMDGEDLMADTIRKITWDADNGGDNFSQFGIYAGYVRRVEEVNERGRYIDVNEVSDTTTADSYRLKTAGAELFAIGAGSNGTGSVVRYEELHLANTDARSDIKSGHKALWVKDNDGDVAFIVDVSYTDGSWKAPLWLEKLWNEVMAQQADERTVAPPPTSSDLALKSITIKGVKVDIPEGKTSASVDLSWKAADDTSVLDYVAVTNPATGVTVSVTAPTSVVTSTSKNDLATDESLTKTTGGQIVWTVKLTDSNDATVDPVYYTIRINVAAASSVATLDAMTVKGLDVTLGAPASGAATGTVAENVSAKVNIDGTTPSVTFKTTNENATVAVKTGTDTAGTVLSADGTIGTTAPLTAGAGKVVALEVTAEDGTTKVVYSVTVTIGAPDVTFDVTNVADATAKVNGTAITAATKALSGEDFKFTVTPDADFYLEDDAVSYKVTPSGGTQSAAKELTADANGVYTIPASDMTSGAAIELTITGTAMPVITATKAMTINGALIAAGDTVAVSVGSDVTILVPSTPTITGTNAWDTIAGPVTGAGNMLEYTITNVVDDIRITY